MTFYVSEIVFFYHDKHYNPILIFYNNWIYLYLKEFYSN